MMKIVEEYVKGLKKAYYDNEGKESWDYFERVMHGASEDDINKLKEEYPNVPDSLVKLLKYTV